MSNRDVRPLVIVTRAPNQSAGLSSRLRAAGYDVLEVPVIEIADAPDGGAALRDALTRLGEYDWLVLTSPNGAGRVRDALARLTAERRPNVAVVGPGTADALGLGVDLVARSSIGEGLVEDFPSGAGRVLLVQAQAARRTVADGLTAKGWKLDVVVGYQTVGVQPEQSVIDAAAQAAAVVFTSGSTVRHFVAAAGRGALAPITVSIGPATTAVAAELGVAITVTSDVHTLDGVVEALVGVLPPQPTAPSRTDRPS